MKKATGFCLVVTLVSLMSTAGCYERLESCRLTGSCPDPASQLGGQGGAAGEGGAGGDSGAGGPNSACEIPCEGEAPLCDEESGQCVQCLTTDDCDEGVCDPQTLRCVECTPETEEERCGDFSCSSLSQSCTTTLRGFRGTCDPCEADSECADGRRCVQHVFEGGHEVGYFCFLDREQGGCGDTVPERRPYRRFQRLSSIGGVEGTYCLPPASTTCQGLRDIQSKECSSNDDCGVEELDDGYCPTSGPGEGWCSYVCVGAVECTSPLECAPDTPRYCRLVP